MNDFAAALRLAVELIGRPDAELGAIVMLSLEVSLTASAALKFFNYILIGFAAVAR